MKTYKHRNLLWVLSVLNILLSGCDSSTPYQKSEQYYSISIDSAENGSVLIDPELSNYLEGETIKLEATAAEGYQFQQWVFSDGTLTKENPYKINVNEDISVTATFKKLENTEYTQEPASRWLVIIHMAVDNNIDYLLEPNFNILSNYTETLENIKSNDVLGLLDIVVLFDSYNRPDNPIPYISKFTDGYYHLTGGNFQNDLVYATGEINSGDPDVSKDFLDWVYSNYAGERVLYSVFNHGEGFADDTIDARGIGFDDSADDDSLSHYELAEIIDYLAVLQGDSIDIFYPFACLMGGVELAWEIKGNVDYLLSSEELIPAQEWSYEALSEINNNSEISQIELAKSFCDSAYSYFNESGEDATVTLSVTDLTKIDNLYSTLDHFGSAATLWVSSNSSNAAILNTLAENSLKMDYPFYTDIQVFMNEVNNNIPTLSFYAQQVIESLAESIVYKQCYQNTSGQNSNGYDMDDAGGISIFHNNWKSQSEGNEYSVAFYQNILEFGRTNSWSDYMDIMYNNTLYP